MTQLISTVAIAVVLFSAGPAQALPPAQAAGLCAANAAVLANLAQSLNQPAAEKTADQLMTYWFNKYSKQSGFAEAAEWYRTQTQNLTVTERVNMANNCVKEDL